MRRCHARACPAHAPVLKTDSARSRRIGIGLTVLGTICFSVIDSSGKWLVQHLPVAEVVWLRFATHVGWMVLLLAPRQGLAIVRMHSPKLQALRAVLMVLMTALNFWALQYLQLAETGAIQFSVPVLIALMSALWLGERLDARRWVAIIGGFLGVLLVVRPGSAAFHPAILLSVANSSASLLAKWKLTEPALRPAMSAILARVSLGSPCSEMAVMVASIIRRRRSAWIVLPMPGFLMPMDAAFESVVRAPANLDKAARAGSIYADKNLNRQSAAPWPEPRRDTSGYRALSLHSPKGP